MNDLLAFGWTMNYTTKILSTVSMLVLGMTSVSFAQTSTEETAQQAADVITDEGSRTSADGVGDPTIIGSRDKDWNGTLSVSASFATGNSDTRSFVLLGDANKTEGLLTHLVDVGYLFGSSGGDTSTNRIFGSYQLNRSFADGLYGLDDRFYGFAVGSAVIDELGAFREDFYGGAGIGYEVINTLDTQWTTDASIGLRYLGDPETSIEPAARIGSRYSTSVNDNVTFTNETFILWSPADTLFVNDLFITTQLTENFGLNAGIRIDHHTSPPNGAEATDTLTYFGITYGF